jgi:hypothetical protein
MRAGKAASAAIVALAAAGATAPAASAGGGGNSQNNLVHAFRVTQVQIALDERVQRREVEDFSTFTAQVTRHTDLRHTGRRGDAAHMVFPTRRVPNGAPLGNLHTRVVYATTTQSGTWSEVTSDGERSSGSCPGRRRYSPGSLSLLFKKRGAAVAAELNVLDSYGFDEYCRATSPDLDLPPVKISVPLSRFRGSSLTIPFQTTKTERSGDSQSTTTFRGSFTLRRVLRCPPLSYPTCNRFQ